MSRRWIGAALLGGLLLSGSPAHAEWRWPWEGPKEEKKEKKEPKPTTTHVPTAATPVPSLPATAADREMLPRLTEYYERQLDLADRATQSRDAEVRSLALKMQRESERALGVLDDASRERGLAIRRHARASISDRLQQSGRLGVAPAPAADDREFLRAAMTNIQGIRFDFAGYKTQTTDRSLHLELGRMFDEELVPDYDEAKQLNDRDRNEKRTEER